MAIDDVSFINCAATAVDTNASKLEIFIISLYPVKRSGKKAEVIHKVGLSIRKKISN